MPETNLPFSFMRPTLECLRGAYMAHLDREEQGHHKVSKSVVAGDHQRQQPIF